MKRDKEGKKREKTVYCIQNDRQIEIDFTLWVLIRFYTDSDSINIFFLFSL